MEKGNVSDLEFSTSAYFYRCTKVINKKDIAKLFRDVTSDMYKNYYVNLIKVQSIKESDCRYSIRVFKDKPKTPSFIVTESESNSEPDSDKYPFWTETKIGYLLVIEYKDYVVVLKKNCSLTKSFLDKLENVGYQELIDTYATPSMSFQRLSMRNLHGSNSSMRSKVYESLDLRENMPTVGASHYYLSSLSGTETNKEEIDSNKKEKISLLLSTSRINKYKKTGVEEICQWVRKECDKITGSEHMSNFLEVFARPEKYEDTLVPCSLLLFLGILENAEFKRIKKDKQRGIDHDAIFRYFDKLSQIIDSPSTIDPKAKVYEFGKISVHLKKKKIEIKNKVWDSVEIVNSGDYDGLLSNIINENSLFNVYFDNHEKVYSNGILFSDSKLQQNFEVLTKVMYVDSKLSDTSCEKFISASTSLSNWDTNSIFYCVENFIASHCQYLICDDLGVEWADHIGLSDGVVSFFVSKHKSSKNSASDFQDVVGQALKNLGNLRPTIDQLTNKEKIWKEKYKNPNVDRFRKGSSLTDAINLWQQINLSPTAKREMCLVIDFLSKKEFEQQLKDIRDGLFKGNSAPVLQRLWILSSFVSSCVECGVEPKIYCKQ